MNREHRLWLAATAITAAVAAGPAQAAVIKKFETHAAGATKTVERLKKECGDEMRLEPARGGALHVLADLLDARGVHRIACQRPLFEQITAALSVG